MTPSARSELRPWRRRARGRRSMRAAGVLLVVVLAVVATRRATTPPPRPLFVQSFAPGTQPPHTWAEFDVPEGATTWQVGDFGDPPDGSAARIVYRADSPPL